MPLILAPYPTAAERRKGKRLPDGRIKFGEIADRALDRYHRDLPAVMAVDTETTGLDWWDRPFCVTASWRTDGGGIYSAYFELGNEAALDLAQELFDYHRERALVFHNAGFDIQKLILAGLLRRSHLRPELIHDTWGQAHLLDTNQVCKLKVLAATYLREGTNEAAALAKCRRALKLTSADGYDAIPRWVLMPYALKDTEYTLRLHELFHPKVLRYPDTMARKYAASMEEILTFYDISCKGMGVDLDYTDCKLKEYGRRAVGIERDITGIIGRPVGSDVAAGEFNPASPAQVMELFESRGHILGATDEAALSQLDGDRLAELILDLRGVNKMRNTYLLALMREARDGILHPNFRPFTARTGRMASGQAEG